MTWQPIFSSSGGLENAGRRGSLGLNPSAMTLDRENLRIAVIDDDEDDCALLQAALIDAGFKQPVTHFEDARIALNYFKYMSATGADAPHIVFLDINLPFIDGVDALFLLREASAFRDLPVIVLTGTDDKDQRRELAHLGIFRFIRKGFNNGAVISALDDFIGLYNHDKAPPAA